MFDRMEKPFLTVETGEAYQPIRLMYSIGNADGLIKALEALQCIQKNPTANSWTWYWKGECDDLHFESVDSFRKTPTHAVRLGTITVRHNRLYMNLPSFKRACMAVPFFHKVLAKEFAYITIADFINKVFALDERLPHGFTELFKDEELDRILRERIEDFHKVKDLCERADTAEEALNTLYNYNVAEAKKRLPYAERYTFDLSNVEDYEVLFLSFYIFLRARELVAIKRWYGQAGYSLADIADEAVEQVFGGLGIDLIE